MDVLKEELADRIADVLDKARFFYDGEIYDGVDFSHSIGYLPDLAYDVGNALGWNEDDSYCLSNYIQIDLDDKIRNVYPILGKTEDYMRMYALLVKNFLIYLLDTNERRNEYVN